MVDLWQFLQRQGLRKWLSVGFGIFSLIALNCFRSDPLVDITGSVIIVGLIIIAWLIPGKEK